MKLLAQHIAHKTDYCVFEIDEYKNEEGKQMLLVHLRVLVWSRDTLRKIKHDWAVFRQAVKSPLYALPMLSPDDPECSKWKRFVELMGWKPLNILVCCNDGLERPLYIHEIDRRTEEGAQARLRPQMA